MNKGYDSLINNQEFRQMVGNERFDLITVDGTLNEFSLPIADLWKVPIITVSPLMGPLAVALGTPVNLGNLSNSFYIHFIIFGYQNWYPCYYYIID